MPRPSKKKNGVDEATPFEEENLAGTFLTSPRCDLLHAVDDANALCAQAASGTTGGVIPSLER